MKFLLSSLIIGFSTIAGATDFSEAEIQMYTIKEISINTVEEDPLGLELREKVYQKQLSQYQRRETVYQQDPIPTPDPIEQAGKIIGVAKDLVALGEDVYNLVIKGKPSVETNYAPISVVPKVNGQPIDPLDMDTFDMPESRSYEVSYKNGFSMTVVKFKYQVIYTPGGSYDGKGKYLTAVQIIPQEAWSLFGYDFKATMKLGGVANHGTRENPIAGATLLIQHDISTVVKATTETNAFQVRGDGKLKKIN